MAENLRCLGASSAWKCWVVEPSVATSLYLSTSPAPLIPQYMLCIDDTKMGSPREDCEHKERDLVIGAQRRYYTPSEVALHNCRVDCWVSIYGKVYNLTPLIKEYAEDHPLIQPILEFAGKDVSEWFDQDTTDVKRALHPELNLILPVLPYGRFLHVAPEFPVSNWSTAFGEPWWLDEERYCIGKLSERTRQVKILNVLTKTETELEVCSEETINEIQDRYLPFNAHSKSYTWKALDAEVFRPLDMDLTLEENGIADESDNFERLGIAEGYNTALIHIYFNDDLTEA